METELTDILYDKRAGVATVTINRPDVLNAFRPRTVDELIAAFQDAWDDDEIAVIVLTGAGDRAFCSGGDQKLRGASGYREGEAPERLRVPELHTIIRMVPKPVIAMVNGYAIGGGHVLHVVCDLSIASETAVFGQAGPAWAASTPGSARSSSRASWERRRRAKSGTCAASTRRKRRWRWGW